MTMRQNVMKQAMLRGEIPVSLTVHRWRSVDIVEIARATEFEWLFIDLEHGVIPEDLAAQIAVVAASVGLTPIARVGVGQFSQASRLMDAGMQGITFPHVDTADQARSAANATKYGPLGKRGIYAPLSQTMFSATIDTETLAKLNSETLTIVMVETVEGADNIEAIASVEGVDGIQVGANDLAADLGVPGQLDHAKTIAAWEKIAVATKKAGKFLGLGGIYKPALLAEYLKAGINFMHGGADIGFVLDGARTRRQMIARAFKDAKST